MECKSNCVRKPSGATSSLFQRVLMQTQKQPIPNPSNDDSLRESNSPVAKNIPLRLNGKGIPDDEGTGMDYIEKIIDLVLHGKGTVREKISSLKAITEYSSENSGILERVVSKEVISYGEKLLISFCDRSSQMTEEMRLLVPLLSLLQTYTNCVEIKVYEASLVKQSDFMYQLMRSCVMCVDTSVSKAEELIKLTRKKMLAGQVRKLAKEESGVKLTRLLGIPPVSSHECEAPKNIIPVESYKVILFDTSSGATEKNINQHILTMESPKLSDSPASPSTLGLDNGLMCQTDLEKDELIWTDIAVANVLPFGEFLAFSKGDWNHWLKFINGELVEFLKSAKLQCDQNDKDPEIRIGSVVGFWSADVTFNWKAPMMMQCFRGIVLGKATSGLSEGGSCVSWAIWAMDIGMLVFGRKAWPLNEDISSIPPLVSICSLDMGEDGEKGESLFLLLALKVLAKLLALKPSAARHMVTFGSRKFENACDNFTEDGRTCDGGIVLKLIVYPDSEIRIEFLKLLILVARSSSEILKYLIECKFYLALKIRLQICVHFCHMLSSDSPLWSEIRLMIMLLSTMAEETEMNVTELPGWNCIEQVLIMLTEIDNHAYVRFMAAKCLASLENRKVTKSIAGQGNKRGSPDGRVPQFRGERSSVREVTSPKKEIHKPTQNERISKGSLRETMPVNFTSMDFEYPEPVLSVLDVGDDSCSDEDSSSLPPVDAVADMARQMDRYTKGYRVTISNDMTHELSQVKYANQISENTLAQTICGFLNNGVGGSVYFGINSQGVIEGLKMSRAQRDNFRKGVDRMMNRSINPEVRPACYDVIYVPVYGPGEVAKGLASHGNWVIEVHVKALPHVIYAVSSNRKCYVRKGSNCVESMSICLRQEAAEQNKKEILQAIEEVKAKIPENKEKLLKFVKDYLEQSKNVTEK